MINIEELQFFKEQYEAELQNKFDEQQRLLSRLAELNFEIKETQNIIIGINDQLLDEQKAA